MHARRRVQAHRPVPRSAKIEHAGAHEIEVTAQAAASGASSSTMSTGMRVGGVVLLDGIVRNAGVTCRA